MADHRLHFRRQFAERPAVLGKQKQRIVPEPTVAALRSNDHPIDSTPDQKRSVVRDTGEGAPVMRSSLSVLNRVKQSEETAVVRRILISTTHPVVGRETPRPYAGPPAKGIHAQTGVIRDDVHADVLPVEPGLGKRVLLEGREHLDVVLAGQARNSEIPEGRDIDREPLEKGYDLTHFVGVARREEELPCRHRGRRLLARLRASDGHRRTGLRWDHSASTTIQSQE